MLVRLQQEIQQTKLAKTAELTPLSATFFAQAIENAGVPNGLINIICGYGNEAGSYLVSFYISHP